MCDKKQGGVYQLFVKSPIRLLLFSINIRNDKQDRHTSHHTRQTRYAPCKEQGQTAAFLKRYC
jgi:hypothetical protein